MDRLVFISLLCLLISPQAWGGGVLSGVVRYQGIPPIPKKTPVTTDQAVCGQEAASQELIVSRYGGIKNAVIYLQGPVSGPRSFPRGEGGFVIEQKGCRFDPRVRIVGAGHPLEVWNSDGINHNFHTDSRSNLPVSRVQPGLSRMSLTFDRSEIFQVRCDIHPWMSAWLVVAEHPYYVVSDEEGRFKLTDVPAGDYTVKLWHESLGVQTKRLQVKEGGETKVEFKLTKGE